MQLQINELKSMMAAMQEELGELRKQLENKQENTAFGVNATGNNS